MVRSTRFATKQDGHHSVTKITGVYVDEFTGRDSQASVTLSSVVSTEFDQTITANLNIATTAVALLVDDKLKNSVPVSSINLSEIEQNVRSKIEDFLQSIHKLPPLASGYLFTSQPSSHLLLGFLLASVLSAQNPMAAAQQYAANVVANHSIGEVEPGIQGGVSKQSLEQSFAALKFDTPIKPANNGPPVTLDKVLSNLQLAQTTFATLLSSSLKTGLPQVINVPPPAYQQLFVNRCAEGGSTGFPGKYERGTTITFTFPVHTCLIPSPVPLSMDLHINTTPYVARNNAIVSYPPTLCSDWSDPACFLNSSPPPNPGHVCPAGALCTLSLTKVTTDSSVNVTLTVQLGPD